MATQNITTPTPSRRVLELLRYPTLEPDLEEPQAVWCNKIRVTNQRDYDKWIKNQLTCDELLPPVVHVTLVVLTVTVLVWLTGLGVVVWEKIWKSLRESIKNVIHFYYYTYRDHARSRRKNLGLYRKFGKLEGNWKTWSRLETRSWRSVSLTRSWNDCWLLVADVLCARARSCLIGFRIDLDDFFRCWLFLFLLFLCWNSAGSIFSIRFMLESGVNWWIIPCFNKLVA